MEKHSIEKIYSIAVRTVRVWGIWVTGPSSSPSALCLGNFFLGVLLWAVQPRRLGGVGVEGRGLPPPPVPSLGRFHSARGRLQVLINPGFPLILQKLYLGPVWLKGLRFPSPTSPSEGRDTIPGVAVWEYWGPNCPCPRSVDVLCLGRGGQAEKTRGYHPPLQHPPVEEGCHLGEADHCPCSQLLCSSLEVLLRERGKLWTTLLEGTDYISNRAWRIPGLRVFFKTMEILVESNEEGLVAPWYW